jgi:hypothetical protein
MWVFTSQQELAIWQPAWPTVENQSQRVHKLGKFNSILMKEFDR